jgi:hypothetical protein
MGCNRRPRGCPFRAFGHPEARTLVAVTHLAMFQLCAERGWVGTAPRGWLDRACSRAMQVTTGKEKISEIHLQDSSVLQPRKVTHGR